jgi:hypothetical protein
MLPINQKQKKTVIPLYRFNAVYMEIFMPTPLKVGGHIALAFSGIPLYYLFPSGL